MEGGEGIGIRTSVSPASTISTSNIAAGFIDARTATRPLPSGRTSIPQGRGVGQGVLQVTPITQPPVLRVVILLVLQSTATLATRKKRTAIGDLASLPSELSGAKKRKATSRRCKHVTSAIATRRASRQLPAWHEPRARLKVGAVASRVLP